MHPIPSNILQSETYGPLILSIDCGSQAVRVAIFTTSGRLVTTAAHSHETVVTPDGGREQNPEDWITGIISAGRECLDKVNPKAISAIAVTGTACTVVSCSHHGLPLRAAIHWSDTRAHNEASMLNRMGLSCSAEDGFPKLMYLSNTDAHTFQKSAIITEGVSWINYRLTGQFALSSSTLVRKWNYSQRKGLPSIDRMIRLLSHKLPQKFVASSAFLGYTTGEWSQDLGINSVPVFQAPFDSASAAIGLGMSRRLDDFVFILGSSAGIMTHSRSMQNGSLRKWGPYEGMISTNERTLASGVAYAGWAIRDFVNHFCPAFSEFRTPDMNFLYHALNQQVAKVPSGNHIVSLQGNRHSDKVFELTLPEAISRRAEQDISAGLKLLYESLAAELSLLIASLRTNGITARCSRVGGGLANNRVFLQILADFLGMPLRVSKNPETVTCRGAASLAASGLGVLSFEGFSSPMNSAHWINPSKENHEHYKRILANWCKIKPYLAPFDVSRVAS